MECIILILTMAIPHVNIAMSLQERPRQNGNITSSIINLTTPKSTVKVSSRNWITPDPSEKFLSIKRSSTRVTIPNNSGITYISYLHDDDASYNEEIPVDPSRLITESLDLQQITTRQAVFFPAGTESFYSNDQKIKSTAPQYGDSRMVMKYDSLDENKLHLSYISFGKTLVFIRPLRTTDGLSAMNLKLKKTSTNSFLWIFPPEKMISTLSNSLQHGTTIYSPVYPQGYTRSDLKGDEGIATTISLESLVSLFLLHEKVRRRSTSSKETKRLAPKTKRNFRKFPAKKTKNRTKSKKVFRPKPNFRQLASPNTSASVSDSTRVTATLTTMLSSLSLPDTISSELPIPSTGSSISMKESAKETMTIATTPLLSSVSEVASTASLPSSVKQTALPSSVKETAVPSSVKETAVPSSAQETTVSSSVKGTAVPSSVKETELPSSVNATAVASSVKDTASTIQLSSIVTEKANPTLVNASTDDTATRSSFVSTVNGTKPTTQSSSSINGTKSTLPLSSKIETSPTVTAISSISSDKPKTGSLSTETPPSFLSSLSTVTGSKSVSLPFSGGKGILTTGSTLKKYGVYETDNVYYYPRVVSVSELKRGTFNRLVPWHLCAGFVSTRTQVLTTCSCVVNFDGRYFTPRQASDFVILEGGVFNNRDKEFYLKKFKVKQVIPHERCRRIKPWVVIYDSAILKINGPLLSEYDDDVFPPASWVSDVKVRWMILDQTPCYGVGWGGDSDGFDGKLRVVSVKLISYALCQNMLCNEDKDPNKTCVGDEELVAGGLVCARSEFSCTLDRGSSIYCKRNIFSIVSRGHCYKSEPDPPILLVRLQKISKFIDRQAGKGLKYFPTIFLVIGSILSINILVTNYNK